MVALACLQRVASRQLCCRQQRLRALCFRAKENRSLDRRSVQAETTNRYTEYGNVQSTRRSYYPSVPQSVPPTVKPLAHTLHRIIINLGFERNFLPFHEDDHATSLKCAMKKNHVGPAGIGIRPRD